MIGAKHDAAIDAARRAGGDGVVRPAESGDAEIERRILQAVRSLDYGSVEITVHDARVVQIERREKVRFDGATAAADRPARSDGRSPGQRPGGSRPQD